MLIGIHTFLASRSTEEGQECQKPVGGGNYWGIPRSRTLCWPSVLGRYVFFKFWYDDLYEVEVYSAQRGIIFTI